MVNKFKCSYFFSFLNLLNPQFLFFLPSFARPFTALLLKEYF